MKKILRTLLIMGLVLGMVGCAKEEKNKVDNGVENRVEEQEENKGIIDNGYTEKGTELSVTIKGWDKGVLNQEQYATFKNLILYLKNDEFDKYDSYIKEKGTKNTYDDMYTLEIQCGDINLIANTENQLHRNVTLNSTKYNSHIAYEQTLERDGEQYRKTVDSFYIDLDGVIENVTSPYDMEMLVFGECITSEFEIFKDHSLLTAEHTFAINNNLGYKLLSFLEKEENREYLLEQDNFKEAANKAQETGETQTFDFRIPNIDCDYRCSYSIMKSGDIRLNFVFIHNYVDFSTVNAEIEYMYRNNEWELEVSSFSMIFADKVCFMYNFDNENAYINNYFSNELEDESDFYNYAAILCRENDITTGKEAMAMPEWFAAETPRCSLDDAIAQFNKAHWSWTAFEEN